MCPPAHDVWREHDAEGLFKRQRENHSECFELKQRNHEMWRMFAVHLATQCCLFLPDSDIKRSLQHVLQFQQSLKKLRYEKHFSDLILEAALFNI